MLSGILAFQLPNDVNLCISIINMERQIILKDHRKSWCIIMWRCCILIPPNSCLYLIALTAIMIHFEIWEYWNLRIGEIEMKRIGLLFLLVVFASGSVWGEGYSKAMINCIIWLLKNIDILVSLMIKWWSRSVNYTYTLIGSIKTYSPLKS